MQFLQWPHEANSKNNKSPQTLQQKKGIFAEIYIIII